MQFECGYSSSGKALGDSTQFCRELFASVNGNQTQYEATACALRAKLDRIRTRENDISSPMPIATLCRLFELDEYGAFCLRIALCCEAAGDLRNEIMKLTGSPIPTFDFAFGLYERLSPGAQPERLLPLVASPQSPLRYLFQWGSGETQRFRFLTPLLLRENVLRFLCGEQPLGGRSYRLLHESPKDFLPLHHSAYEAILRVIASPDMGILLAGSDGSGKRTLVRRAAATLGKPCLLIHCAALRSLSESAFYAVSLELAFDAAVSQAAVCISGYAPEHEYLLTTLCQELRPDQPIVIAGCVESLRPSGLKQSFLRREVGVLAPEDFQILQGDFCTRYSTNPNQLGPCLPLTAGQLQTVWGELADRCHADKKASPESADFAAAVLTVTEPVSLAQTVSLETRLDDLIFGEETLERLELLLRLLRARQSESADAVGLTALFYGPSGTGKTASAAAIAQELGRELVKIDLSRIMDKYIGETEKHLRKLFAAARQRGCILFFDEADALFSKRTEISSSHDRYANIETSFLLQSIEEYDGVVLLATNLFKNFDDAFLRRIDLMVHFSMPDSARRQTHWRTLLHGETVGIDVEALAMLELSPAEIALIARNARALCTLEAPLVTMELLRMLIDSELEKRGKRLSATDLFM